MRRDVDRAASLRTGPISRDAVSDGFRSRFFASLRTTGYHRSERQDTIAQNDRVSQNDRVLLLRMMSTASGGQGEAPVLALSAVPCRQESSEITVSTDTDCPIWNGPFAVRRSESRWAPDPRASPRSLAKALMYVPLLHLMRMSA